MTAARVRRIRDPLHNLIEFGATKATEELELILWDVIQTRPFQRLRRIKQLGFSELVFPGATHTRFAHSIGVFHTARLLLSAIERSMLRAGTVYGGNRAQHALAAALVHDVGHGMFSHAFEAVGKALKLSMAKHELVSDMLIRDSEITRALDDRLGSGFASNVADLIAREQPRDVYDSVVTSQFDADRLDYMQRDRMMTGVHSGAVDVVWLLNNPEVSPIAVSVDNEQFRTVESLVLGPKAYHVAESYVLALFHLYPNVYFHKATRGAEMVLRDLILRLFSLNNEGRIAASGLPGNHPLVRFVLEPDKLDHVQALDDTVLWGALPMLIDAEDAQIDLRARQLRDRKLLACFDIWNTAAEILAPSGREEPNARAERIARLNLTCDRVLARANEVSGVMFDDYKRDPYKRFQDSRTPPNQIHIMQDGKPRDMAELSSVVGSAEPFRICRAYLTRGDMNTEDMPSNIVRTECDRTISDKIDSIQMVRPASGRGWRRPSN
jgi:HD superfamily phosphohydrolase